MLKPAIVGCRDPDTVSLIPDEWDATLRRSGYSPVSKARNHQCHHSLFPHDMQTFAKCDEESYSKFDQGLLQCRDFILIMNHKLQIIN